MFYKRSGLDPRIPIYFKDFLECYESVSALNMFQIARELTLGFEPRCLNVEQEQYEDDLRRKSVKPGKATKLCKGLSAVENEHVKAFFEERIQGGNAAEVTKVYK